jgi:hypothetical protein
VRRFGFLIGAVVAAVTILAAVAIGDTGKKNNKTFEYAIGLWGDMPYSDTQAQSGVPSLIADMNNSEIDFSVHDGESRAPATTAAGAVKATRPVTRPSTRPAIRPTSSGCRTPSTRRTRTTPPP